MAAIAAVVAGLLSGAGAVFSHKSGSRAAKKKKRALRKQTAIQRSVEGTALDQKEASVRRAAEKRLGGLSTAERDINRALREREAVMQGSVSQDLARSGLGSTSVGINAKRAVSSDTSRAMSDLLSQLAQTRGDIEASREEALGNLAMQRGQMQSGLAQQEGMGMSELDYQGPSIAEGLTGALGAGLGAYMGAGGNFGRANPQMQQMDLMRQIYGPAGLSRGLGGGYGGSQPLSYYRPFMGQ